MKALIGGGALSAVPLIVEEEEEQPSGFTGSVGGQIDQEHIQILTVFYFLLSKLKAVL